MRVKEELKRLGNFWLPSAKERKIPGTLSISDGGNIELEVSGLFAENELGAINASLRVGRIVGHIEKEGFVTLEDCFYTSRNISLGGGISTATLRVSTIYIGAAFDEKENILFNALHFSVEGIDAWVGISGIEINQNSEGSTSTISYRSPQEIQVNLNNGMRLLITFRHTFAGSPGLPRSKNNTENIFPISVK